MSDSYCSVKQAVTFTTITIGVVVWYFFVKAAQ
jgi:hypothetical protein